MSENGGDIPESRGRGRPRRNQGTFADVVIEDPELEEELATILDTADAATDHRKSGAQVRKLMLERHKDKINSDGGVIVGPFRFKPRASSVDARTSTVKRKAGVAWSALEVSRNPGAAP